MRTTFTKKTLSLLVAACVLLNIIPFTAMAAFAVYDAVHDASCSFVEGVPCDIGDCGHDDCDYAEAVDCNMDCGGLTLGSSGKPAATPGAGFGPTMGIMSVPGDQTVTILQTDSVADIEINISNAITATGGSGTVTVTNEGGTPYTVADVPLSLTIPVGVTVRWEAEYSGDVEGNMFQLEAGAGAFEIVSGIIANENTGYSRAINVGNGIDVTVSGGTVSAAGIYSAIQMTGDNGSLTVSGNGLVTAGGTGSAINTIGSTTVNIKGGIVRATTGTALNVGPNVSSTTVSGGTIEATGFSGTAIYAFGAVTVSGGTVRATNGNAFFALGTSAVITVSGGDITGGVNTAMGGTVQYAVYYDANGGTGVPATEFKNHGDDTFTLSGQGSMTNGAQTFTGWNTQADGGGTSYAAGASYTTNEWVTLYAQWVSNQLVTINQADSVTEIQTKIHDAIDTVEAAGGRTVTVTGGKNNADAKLSLTIPAGITVRWAAEYSGDVNSEVIRLESGAGAFEIVSGKITNNGTGGFTRAIIVNDSTDVTVSGGTVSSRGNHATIHMLGSGGSLTVSGDGLVEETGNQGTAIDTTDATGAIVINIKGGIVRAANQSTALRLSSNVISTTVSGGKIEATSGTAIFADNGSAVTVSGGTVRSASGNAFWASGSSSVITVSGGVDQSYGGTVRYTVNYDANAGGDSSVIGDLDSPKFKIHSTPLRLPELSRTDYVFVGWNTQADGSGTLYEPRESYTDDTFVTLYAQWVDGPPKITINTHPAASTTVTEGSITGRLSVVASVTQGATLSYQWYVLTPGGGSIKKISGATEATFPIPTDLTVGRYEYYCEVSATGGATPVSSTSATVRVNPPKSVTVGAQVGRVTAGTPGSATYPVTADGLLSSQTSFAWYTNMSGTTGTSAPTGVTPSIADVWEDFLENPILTMAADATGAAGTYYFRVTIDGVTSNVSTLVISPAGTPTYTVTFNLNGGTRTGGGAVSQTVASGGSATAPTVTRSGYTFTGWDRAFTNVTANITVNARWTQNQTGGGNGGGGGGGGGSGGGGSGATGSAAAPQQQTLSTSAAASLIQQAANSGQGFVRTSQNGPFSVNAAAWAALVGRQFQHDSTGSPVQVRVYIDKPELMQGDVMVSAWTKGADVDRIRNHFSSWFANTVQVVYFDHRGPWGQRIRAAAKVDLTGMDVEKLVLYSYDQEANSYRIIANPSYRIDANGYLHFYTELAGAIIVSDGALDRKI